MMCAIILVMAFLLLFVVYPLFTILTQSFETDYPNTLISQSQRITSRVRDGALKDSPFYRLANNCNAYATEFKKGAERRDAIRMAELGELIETDFALIHEDRALTEHFLSLLNASFSEDATPLGENALLDIVNQLKVAYENIGETHFTLEVYLSLFTNRRFLKVVGNTLLLGAISGLCSTLIGFLFAYVDTYVRTRMRGIFKVISMLPIVSPPFVLSLSMIMIFGRKGLITYHLLGIKNANIYGMHGILIVQILTFFPVAYLMLKGLLGNIDPSLEESARNMGASRWRDFRDVTLPLLLTGLGNAFLVSFIESVADFTNPIMIGGDFNTLAAYIYMQISNFDTRSSSGMAVILLTISMVLFVIMKYVLERRSVANLTGKASRMRMQIEDASVRIPPTLLCSLVGVFVIAMYAMVPVGACFKLWGKDFSFTLRHFANVFGRDTKPFVDSLYLSLTAAVITSVLSMIIAYLIVKKRLLQVVRNSPPCLPWPCRTVLGIAPEATSPAYSARLHGAGGPSAIIIIAFVVRSLPIGTAPPWRAESDRQIHRGTATSGRRRGQRFTASPAPHKIPSFPASPLNQHPGHQRGHLPDFHVSADRHRS